ncbi:MAG: carboxypeptidase-like regulatory domain-containing protein [Longimicrobiales bacterium]
MRRVVLLAIMALLVAAPSMAEAQAVTGLVRDQSTGSPVAAAEVSLVGLGLAALTQGNGEYLILNVPSGTHTMTVQSLGYRTETVTVTVGAGESVVQNVSLSQQALQLNELVVTGTAGASRVREWCNRAPVTPGPRPRSRSAVARRCAS